MWTPTRADVWIEGVGLRAGLLTERLVVRDSAHRLLGKHPLIRVQSVLLVGPKLSISTELLQACAARGIAVGAVDTRRLLILSESALWADVQTRTAQLDALRSGKLPSAAAPQTPSLLTLRLAWMARVAGLDPALGGLAAWLAAQLPDAPPAPQALAAWLRAPTARGPSVAATLQHEVLALAAWLRGEREAWRMSAPCAAPADEDAEKMDDPLVLYTTPAAGEEEAWDDDAALV